MEKTLMLGKTEGKRRRGQQRMRWLDGITDSVDSELGQTLGDSRASLVTQMVKNLLAVQETWV